MTIAQELIEAKAKIEELSASVAKGVTEGVEALAKIEGLTAQVKELTESKAALVSAHAKAIEDATAKLTAESNAHAQTSTALAEATKKLSDPAYKMASVAGDSAPAPEGGAAASQSPLTYEQAQAEYRKLDGKPEEQKAYRVSNWRVLGCEEEKA